MDWHRESGPNELDSRLARAIRELEKIWEEEPRLGKKQQQQQPYESQQQQGGPAAQDKEVFENHDVNRETSALTQLLDSMIDTQNNTRDVEEKEPPISKFFIENFVMRFYREGNTQNFKQRSNLKVLCIYNIYKSYPSLRPLVRLALAKSLSTVRIPKDVSQAYGVKSVLCVLIAILKGMVPGQGKLLAPLITQTLMPLLQCTAFLSPRTAEPLLSVYKNSLTHCLYLAIKNDSTTLALPAMKALVQNWRGVNPNTEREVILLDILDLLLDAASQSQQPWEAEGCLRVSLGPLTSACMSVNSRIAERSLSIATHSTAIMRSIVAGGDGAKKEFYRALITALYAQGSIHWDTSINRMRLEAFMKLESLDQQLFNSSCAQPHASEILAAQMNDDCTIEETNDDIQFMSIEDIPEESEGKSHADPTNDQGESDELMGTPVPTMRAPKPGDLKRGRWTPTVAPFGRVQPSAARPPKPVMPQLKTEFQQPKVNNSIPRPPTHSISDRRIDSSLQSREEKIANTDNTGGASKEQGEQINALSSKQTLESDTPEGLDCDAVFKLIEKIKELVTKENKEKEYFKEQLQVEAKLKWEMQSDEAVAPQLLPLPLPDLAFHDLVFGAELGRGTFATVHFVKRIIKTSPPSLWPAYAAKVLSSEVIEKHSLWVQLSRELATLRSIHHEGISRLLSIFRLKDDIYMVFELGEKGDLLSLLSEKGSLNEATTKFLMAEVATTVRYLHQVGFVYCDLKPENVLITKEGHAKLSDFGSVRPLSDTARRLCMDASKSIRALRDGDWKVKAGISPAVSEWMGSHALEKTYLESEQGHAQFEDDERLQGTAVYLAPEIVAGEEMTPASDAWALGCVIFQCLVGQTPIKEQILENIFQEIANFSIERVLEDVKSGSHGSTELSSSALEVIAALMTRKVAERTQSFDRIFSFDFFSSLDVNNPQSLFKMQPPELKKGAFPKLGANGARRQFSTILWAPSHGRQMGLESKPSEKEAHRDNEREKLIHDNQLELKTVLEDQNERGSPFMKTLTM